LTNLILIYKDGKISFWILIGSAVVGLIFLICVIVALWKVSSISVIIQSAIILSEGYKVI